jgi:hypothetical protein
MNGRRWTGQVVNLIYFQKHWLNYIVPQQFKTAIIEQVENVFAPAGKEIVEADNVVAFANKSLAKVGADEARAAGYEDSHMLSFLISLSLTNS